METTAEHVEQLESLTQMCEQTSEIRSKRHARSPLYKRLGGYEKILTLTREIVRLHNANADIQHMFSSVNSDALAKHVADFMSAGTGGNAEYQGRSMVDAHVHLGITSADFLSAGGDVIKAMENLGYSQDEIDEVVCILLSLMEQVVQAR